MSVAVSVASSARDVELARLVQQQEHDALLDRLPAERRGTCGRWRVVRESDLAFRWDDRADLDRLVDAHAIDPAALTWDRPALRLAGVRSVWGPAEVGYAPPSPCPACHGSPGRWTVCLVCSASGSDSRCHPQQAPKTEQGESRKRRRTKPVDAADPARVAMATALAARRLQAKATRRAERQALYQSAPVASSVRKPTRVAVRMTRDFLGHHADEVVTLRSSQAENWCSIGVAVEA